MGPRVDKEKQLCRAITPMCTYKFGQWELNAMKILKSSVQSCPVVPELHLSFDATSPPGCCLESREILLNKDMKY
jgi:hypothetical protein